MKATGLSRVQLDLDPLHESPERWEVGFTGDLCIEREAGTTRVEDIAAARVVVEGIQ